MRFQDLLTTAELPELGPGPRAKVQSATELNRAVDMIAAGLRLERPGLDLVRGLVLLWHDRLEEGHVIAQQIESADGSYLHGIMHRREPDYGNAKYWFRLVGRHACFGALAERAGEWLRGRQQDRLAATLLPRGIWDPYAFIDACERASRLASSDEEVSALREIQAIELRTFLEQVGGAR